MHKNIIKTIPKIITDLFKKNTQGKDPYIETNLNASFLSDTFSASFCYQNMYLSNDVFISFLAVGKNGCFLFIPFTGSIEEQQQKIHEKISVAKKYFSITEYDSFFIAVSDSDDMYLMDRKDKSFIHLKEPYEQLSNLYDNTLRPYVDLNYLRFHSLQDLLQEAELPDEYVPDNSMNGKEYQHEGIKFVIKDNEDIVYTGELNYVKSVFSTEKIDTISSTCSRIEGNERPLLNEKTVIDEDGYEQHYILRYSERCIGGDNGLNTGLVGEKKWFLVSDEDSDRMCLITATLGCFGIHKFMKGSILEGLFYFLTCGCIGILPAVDIFTMIANQGYYYTYSYYEDEQRKLHRKKEKIYYRPLNNKLLAVFLMLLCIGIGILLSQTLMKFIFSILLSLVSYFAGNMSEAQLTDIVSKLSLFTK